MDEAEAYTRDQQAIRACSQGIADLKALRDNQNLDTAFNDADRAAIDTLIAKLDRHRDYKQAVWN